MFGSRDKAEEGVHMSLRPVTTTELGELALRYLNTPSERTAIIEKVHNSGRDVATRVFAGKIGVEHSELIGWAKKYYRAKKLCLHKKPVTVWAGDPPARDISAEAAELAEELVGIGGGEWRECRRNTFAKTMNSRARKQRQLPPLSH